MTSERKPPATSVARRGAAPWLPTGAASGVLQRRARLAASHRRSRWTWALLGLLLAFSLTITVLYAAALTGDISLHHWTAALVASRAVVPAAVGWGALIMVFFAGSAATERMLTADARAVRSRQWQAARDLDSVRSAGRRVQELTARLDELAAGREQAALAGAPASPELDRTLADTTARLDQARQWLTGARGALAASRLAVTAAEEKMMTDIPHRTRRQGPTAGKAA